MDIFDKLHLPMDIHRWAKMKIMHQLPLPTDIVNYIGLYDILTIKKISKNDKRMYLERPIIKIVKQLFTSVRCCVKFSNKYHILFMFIDCDKIHCEYFNTKYGAKWSITNGFVVGFP